VVEYRLLAPQSEAKSLKWRVLAGKIAAGDSFQEAQIRVVEPSGKRYEFAVYNVFATAIDGVITDVNARPAWASTTGERLADLIEQQLKEWQVPLGDKERESFTELRKMGVPGMAPGMWGYIYPLPGEVVLRVRIQGIQGKGWFAVFEFGVPQDKRPK